MSLRKIIHVDMGAFYASSGSVMIRSLSRKEVIVCLEGKRSVVCGASYVARAFWVAVVR
jgi:DNA polymerase-4